jgi:nucleotide-binding universal stress UspA family protein
MRSSPDPDRFTQEIDDTTGGLGPAVMVVGVDGTESSMRALAWAVGLAQRSGSRVVGTHVPHAKWSAVMCSSVELSGIAPVPLRDYLTTEPVDVKHLTEVFVDIGRGGVHATLELQQGNPVTAIVRAAQLHRADLIVIGASTRRTRRSVAAGVVRQATCPVTVIP